MKERQACNHDVDQDPEHDHQSNHFRSNQKVDLPTTVVTQIRDQHQLA